MVSGIWKGREAKGPPPFCPPPDMTTPLGLSRQHLSYLQEIGSGWFGKVSGSGGGEGGGSIQSRAVLLFCVLPPSPAPTTSHLSPAPQPTQRPHLCPPLTCSRLPHPPTSVSQRLPPHSIDHSASPPGSPRVRLSILPSVPASIGLWARESLTLHLLGGTRVMGSEGRGWKEGGSWSHAVGWRWPWGWGWGDCRH